MEKTNKLLTILIALILIPELLLVFAIIDPSGRIEKSKRKNEAIDAFCDEYALDSKERKKIKIVDYWYRNGEKLFGLLFDYDEGKMTIEYDGLRYYLIYDDTYSEWTVYDENEEDFDTDEEEFDEDFDIDEDEAFDESEESIELTDTSEGATAS